MSDRSCLLCAWTLILLAERHAVCCTITPHPHAVMSAYMPYVRSLTRSRLDGGFCCYTCMRRLLYGSPSVINERITNEPWRLSHELIP
ncbi:hypothetical protein IE81DRAFT_322820 [Ceraceosorus guamensis]|uniref:Secreted protein n=1 Tax=Ceraceosorus guamensis TaxID=1522189 RepID=A0A316W3C2_9BASI|nr:hypothetical protein IE81DRAFT_322820 [Ceraceosorus guamensis]PWN43101.1 hypothetical protein IE81DRAFT_322820 [Ceraceosorus guamensis]